MNQIYTANIGSNAIGIFDRTGARLDPDRRFRWAKVRKAST